MCMEMPIWFLEMEVGRAAYEEEYGLRMRSLASTEPDASKTTTGL